MMNFFSTRPFRKHCILYKFIPPKLNFTLFKGCNSFKRVLSQSNELKTMLDDQKTIKVFKYIYVTPL